MDQTAISPVHQGVTGRTVLEWLCVVKGPGVIRSLADACAKRGSEGKTVAKVVLRAGLGRTVLSAVTAVMEDCVTRSQETAPVDWAGQETAVIQSVPKADMGPTAGKYVIVKITAPVTE